LTGEGPDGKALSPGSEGHFCRFGDVQAMISPFPPNTPEEQQSFIMQARSKIGPTLIWKRFIITKKGYIGTAPAGSRVGDIVAVLLGGATPFILRKYDSTYRLVGER
jgi:hypothetical protein